MAKKKWKQGELKLEPEKKEQSQATNYREQFFKQLYKEKGSNNGNAN
jgi:hypothetical protein